MLGWISESRQESQCAVHEQEGTAHRDDVRIRILTSRPRLLVICLLIAACSSDRNPSPTKEGRPQQEIVLPGSPILIGAGDIAVCGTPGDEATGALVDSLLRADSASGVQSVVATFGDNAYPSGQQGVTDDFPRCFTPSWGRPRIMNVIHTAPGNHDYDSGSGDPYFAYFGDRAGPAGKGYYSYDVGGWHIISLNSELYFENDDPAKIKAQEDWLERDLQQHKTRCALAYFHRPLFSSGVYGATAQLRQVWDLLFADGVDLVLNGHEHAYERFLPQTPDGTRDSVRGVVEIISGTGGGDLRRFRYPLARNSAAQIQGHFGVLKVSLGDGEYAHSFIDTSGMIWDTGRGRCH
ncbi:MAG TPA: metallophosphoesterase [Gemmatimonadaceae bacterium]|nr:metallophosphoesterase [Gemmatimonadaceae bacterium]